MKTSMKVFVLSLLLFVTTSCGSLRLSPQGCQTVGEWGAGPQKLDEREVKYTEEYFVFTEDKEIKLSTFLKEKGLSCKEIKKIRVQMSSVFFVKRILDVYIIR